MSVRRWNRGDFIKNDLQTEVNRQETNDAKFMLVSFFIPEILFERANLFFHPSTRHRDFPGYLNSTGFFIAFYWHLDGLDDTSG